MIFIISCLALISQIFQSEGLILYPLTVSHLVTCSGKKISVLSNSPTPNDNLLNVVVSPPLSTLSVISPCNSEVKLSLIIIQSDLSGVLDVLCPSLPAYSLLHGISL